MILELLVPATGADQEATGGIMHRYNDELRPGHTLQVMEYLQDYGVEPAFWAVKGLDRHDAPSRWPQWQWLPFAFLLAVSIAASKAWILLVEVLR